MPYLSGRTIHVDKHLTQFALNYSQAGRFIADKIFPVVNVGKQSDMVLTWDQGQLWRVEDTKRSRGSEANRIEFDASSASYYAENFAIADTVTLEDKINADDAFMMMSEQGRVQRLVDTLMLDWEARIASTVTSTSNVGTSTAVASAWTDYTNSTPFTDMETMISNVEDITGFRPNRIVFGTEAFRHIRRNNTIIDKIQNTGISGGGMTVNAQQLAQLFGVDAVYVGQAYKNTANEGKTKSIAPVWGDHVFMYYAPEAPSIVQPSYGYTLRWNAPGLPNMSVTRENNLNTLRRSETLEVSYYQDELVLSTVLGALVTNVTSST